jgi:predicted Fe-S protein YdhL (DUF1289 family)
MICKVVDGVCIGCNRTQDEIRAWPDATADQRRKILDDITERYKLSIGSGD